MRNSPTAIRVCKSAVNASEDGDSGLQVIMIIYKLKITWLIGTSWCDSLYYWTLILLHVSYFRHLREMPLWCFMELRKAMRGDHHICSTSSLISPSFQGFLNAAVFEHLLPMYFKLRFLVSLFSLLVIPQFYWIPKIKCVCYIHILLIIFHFHE